MPIKSRCDIISRQMNHLAKHFFDYQSFVNLPHKAVQLHKTPCQQAGVDPSAGWAPKSMHYAGKNQAAPAARANRNHLEPRNVNRHGRPSKLEFRTWGDRHGELHAEKIVPHKDAWMVSLNGDFKHFHENDELYEEQSGGEFFPKRPEALLSIETNDVEILTILTLASHKEFVTVTIKRARGIPESRKPYVKVQLFDGLNLIEQKKSERIMTPLRSRKMNGSPRNNDLDQSQKENHPSKNFLLRQLSLLTSPKKKPTLTAKRSGPPVPFIPHNGSPRNKEHSTDVLDKTTGFFKSAILTPAQKRRAHYNNKSISLSSSAGTSTDIEDNLEQETELGDSFVLHVSPNRIQHSYIFIQLYARKCLPKVEESPLKTINKEQTPKSKSIDTENQIPEKPKRQQEDELIGGCIIGPMDTGSLAHFHWTQMYRKKGHPVCMWHRCIRPPKHLLENVENNIEQHIEHSNQLNNHKTSEQ